MIEATLSRRTPVLLFGLLTGTLIFLFHSLIHSATYGENPGLLATAITADLLLTVPLAYLLLARKYRLPYRLVAPLFIAMVFAGSWLLPGQDRAAMDAIRMVAVPLVEIAVIAFLVLAIRKARHTFRSTESWDTTAKIDSAAMKITGHQLPAALVASELSMFYYLFRRPGAAAESPPDGRPFPSHGKSPVLAILAVLSMAVVIETFAIHLLVGTWSRPVAWLLSALSVYSLLFLIAHGRALAARPHVISADYLHIRNGLLWSVDIPRDRIATVVQGGAADPGGKDRLNAVTIVQPNLTVTLKGDMVGTGIYGIRKRFSTVSFLCDDPAVFKTELQGTKTTPTA